LRRTQSGIQRQVPTKSCSKAKQWFAEYNNGLIAHDPNHWTTNLANGVNDDNGFDIHQRCSSCYINCIVRFAICLGMLLGMSHGWVMAETRSASYSDEWNILKTVKSDTSLVPFSSGSYSSFPY
jgi:hypothetical protein